MDRTRAEGVDRRRFLQAAGAVAAAAGLPALGRVAQPEVPSYLTGFADLYELDPAMAAREWFRRAEFGLFMHLGLYSILGRGEWVMFQEQIPVAEYEALAERYHPDRFDADFITDLASEAGMRYVTVTARHHDSYCLFESTVSDYNSAKTSPHRDMIGELAIQCQKKGLGLFLYYSYALDWRHPYFYSRESHNIARPAYKSPEPSYKFKDDADFARYIEFVHAQIRELLTNYGPIAGMWFDPIMGYYARPDLFPIEDTYRMVRQLQPQCLISFKQGATGTEDFAAPERGGHSLADRVERAFGDPVRTAVAARAWESNRHKHNEICDTLQPGAWGYKQADDGKHRDAETVWEMLGRARGADCNLLLNTGPLPDGSIHPVDARVLREVGRRIETEGYPTVEPAADGDG